MVSANPTEDELHELLTKARLQLKKFEPEPWSFGTAAKQTPSTPSEWFSEKFPEQAKIHGTPFLEMVEDLGAGLKRVNPLSPNIDFLAAILGGDKRLGHQVVYLEGEMQFFYFDPRGHLYKPVSEDKLGNLLRSLLIRCAEELPASVHKLNLFLEFRSDKTVRAIIHRAKSILAADHTFFSQESKNVREKGPEVHERVARVFAEQVLERQAGEVLTFSNAYLLFTEFLRQKSMAPVKKPLFKGMFAPLIREVYDLGLRNDVIDQQSQKQTAGWKGLHAVELETVAARN